jgi:hypothetical protein
VGDYPQKRPYRERGFDGGNQGLLAGSQEWPKRPNIIYSCSFVEPRPKMVMITTVIIMGHEYIWRTIWEISLRGDGERKGN